MVPKNRTLELSKAGLRLVLCLGTCRGSSFPKELSYLGGSFSKRDKLRKKHELLKSTNIFNTIDFLLSPTYFEDDSQTKLSNFFLLRSLFPSKMLAPNFRAKNVDSTQNPEVLVQNAYVLLLS